MFLKRLEAGGKKFSINAQRSTGSLCDLLLWWITLNFICKLRWQGSYGIVKLAYDETDDMHYVSLLFVKWKIHHRSFWTIDKKKMNRSCRPWRSCPRRSCSKKPAFTDGWLRSVNRGPEWYRTRWIAFTVKSPSWRSWITPTWCVWLKCSTIPARTTFTWVRVQSFHQFCSVSAEMKRPIGRSISSSVPSLPLAGRILPVSDRILCLQAERSTGSFVWLWLLSFGVLAVDFIA